MRKHLWNPPTDTYSPNVGSLYPIQVYTWQNVYNNFWINHFWVNNFWINHFSVSVSWFLMCVNAHTFMRFCALSDSKLVSLRWRWIFNPIQLGGEGGEGADLPPPSRICVYFRIFFATFPHFDPQKITVFPGTQKVGVGETMKPRNL